MLTELSGRCQVAKVDSAKRDARQSLGQKFIAGAVFTNLTIKRNKIIILNMRRTKYRIQIIYQSNITLTQKEWHLDLGIPLRKEKQYKQNVLSETQ